MAGEWYLDPRVTELLPFVVGGFVLLILWFISIKFWRAIFGRRVKSVAVEAGIQFGDIEAMRKRGLISDEEYKVIRRTMAERASERMAEEQRQSEERRIFAEAQVDPDAARKLLADAPGTPKTPPLAQASPRAQAPPRVAPTPAPPPQPQPVQPARPASRFSDLDLAPSASAQASPPPAPPPAEPEWPTELGMMTVSGAPAAPAPDSAAPTPSMNNPRVVRARNEARAAEAEAQGSEAAQKRRDIDVLLDKGAISREEYDRLRKFFE